ncbi:hypothetical protein ACFL6G_03370 [candidate division KSB1 bacterium]
MRNWRNGKNSLLKNDTERLSITLQINLSYLELEDVFSSALIPEEHLSRLVKRVRNVDVIKNMTNSEIVPFLRIFI